MEVFRGWALEVDFVVHILTAGNVKSDLGDFRMPQIIVPAPMV